MSKWSVGNLVPASFRDGASSMALSLGGIAFAGGVVGAGLSKVAQNIEAFGFFAALTGSRLGVTGMDYGSLGKGALIGAGVGVATGLALLGADRLKSWRSERQAQAAFDKTAQGPKM